MPHGSSHTVGPSVAAADDNDIFAFGQNEITIAFTTEHRLRVRRKEIHRKMDPLQLPPFNWQIAWLGGACANHNRIKLIHQLLRRHVLADFTIALEGNSFPFHLLEP